MLQFNIDHYEIGMDLQLEDGTPAKLIANDVEFGLIIGCKHSIFKMSPDGIFCDMFGRKHRVFFK